MVGREFVNAEGYERSSLCLDENRLGVDECSVEIEGDGGRVGEAIRVSDGGAALTQALVEEFEEVFGSCPGWSGLAGLDALFEHLEAEGTGDAHGVGAGFEELIGADVVDASAAALLHPHVASAGSAAEAPVAALFHFAQLKAGDSRGDLAGSVVHAVVASKVAGVVVGQRRVDGDERLEHPSRR